MQPPAPTGHGTRQHAATRATLLSASRRRYQYSKLFDVYDGTQSNASQATRVGYFYYMNILSFLRFGYSEEGARASLGPPRGPCLVARHASPEERTRRGARLLSPQCTMTSDTPHAAA